tara:strand:+ start:1128 stop:2810 length:1683 start_codon:yes stop_codon:yes gene_type:complete
MVEINIDISDTWSQRIKVLMKWRPKDENQKLIFPSWTPGSYTIRDHVKNLYNLRIQQNSEDILPNRNSPNEWNFNIISFKEIDLSYIIEANDLTVRTSYLSDDFASLCLASICFLIEECRHSEYKLNIIKPNNWNLIPSPLKYNNYYFENYDILLDTPIHAGLLTSHPFKVRANTHKMVCINEANLPNSFIEDVRLVCESTCSLMNMSPPAGDDYTFILFMNDVSYGGLEHDNYSVLHFNWKLLSQEGGYRKLLQLIGHEYLHQWNVRRLRPIEYINYDYSNPIISEGLWFAEGITSYFDLFLPLMSKLSTEEELYIDLSTEITRLFRTPGRFIHSLSDSSKEAWVKLYKSNPNSKYTQVNYYNLGTFLAFCIDIELRLSGSSLQLLLVSMYNDENLTKNGYSRSDIIEYINKYSTNLGADLSNYLDKPDSIPIKKYFNELGLILFENQNDKFDLGFSTFKREGSYFVNSVNPKSEVSKAGLVIKDELIAINNFRINDIDDLDIHIKFDQVNNILVSRHGRLVKLGCNFQKVFDLSWEIKQNEFETKDNVALREQWLNVI